MWAEYAGEGPGSAPQAVSVASLLWDVARLSMHERGRLEGLQELDVALLQEWVANFTEVVRYAQQAFPQTKLWLTHTTLPPHHDVATGLMTKPYLGRLYFIHQLNAAAAAAARRLGLQLVDYAAIGQRFATGQQHLTDLIHPNAMVGVEVFNVVLNLVLQKQQQQQEGQQQQQQLGGG
ncbi:hypothetical protein OEZ85_009983 [Tetradesmus obliquus]|uniref:SGNH hydrolase-type esterase domain-containing protein n=1 Tax=Tetradesmus obliquus TaxID=3088 RepID=A0ABY8UBA5_TETOB|nr:hypothetical protein OEZ85_009983 [Tetradesmus obliquus]